MRLIARFDNKSPVGEGLWRDLVPFTALDTSSHFVSVEVTETGATSTQDRGVGSRCRRVAQSPVLFSLLLIYFTFEIDIPLRTAATMTTWSTCLLTALYCLLYVANGQIPAYRERVRLTPDGQPSHVHKSDSKMAPILHQRFNEAPSQEFLATTKGISPSSDFMNFLYGRDGKDGPMKQIMRLLRILPPKEPITFTDNGQPLPYVPPVPTTPPPPSRATDVEQICPKGAEPFFNLGYYKFCAPQNNTDCPVDFVCNYSQYVTTYICCKGSRTSASTLPPTLTQTDLFSSSSTTAFLNSLSSTVGTSPTTTQSSESPNISTTTLPPKWTNWSSWSEWTTPSVSTGSTAPWTTPEQRAWPSLGPYPLGNRAIIPEELLVKSWPSLAPYPVDASKAWPSLPTYPIDATKAWPSLPTYPIDANSVTSLFPIPTPNIFPYQTASNIIPFQKVWETTDAEIESQWTLFPSYMTPPLWTPDSISTHYPTVHPTPNTVSPTMDQATTSASSREYASHGFATPVMSQLDEVEIIPLTVGNIVPTTSGDFEWATTITLIRDGEKTILVDTGLPADTNILIRELSRHGMRPDTVDTVVITHGHPDHFGNQNLFSRKVQLFSSFQFLGNKFSRTSLSDHQFRKLTSHVEIWKTPGHTPEDLSVIVRDVPSLGVVAVVGDLIVNEDFLLNPDHWANSGSWDRFVQQRNINIIVCMADCIVPGHGPMFRVHEEHRKRANCAQRYESKFANYFG